MSNQSEEYTEVVHVACATIDLSLELFVTIVKKKKNILLKTLAALFVIQKQYSIATYV